MAAYNAAGHLQSAQDFARNGRDLINQIDFVRRADGRVTQQIDSLSGSTLNEFDYDANGRATHRQTQPGQSICAHQPTPFSLQRLWPTNPN